MLIDSLPRALDGIAADLEQIDRDVLELCGQLALAEAWQVLGHCHHRLDTQAKALRRIAERARLESGVPSPGPKESDAK